MEKVEAFGLGVTQDQEDTLLSVIAEADRHIREVPTAAIDRAYLRELFNEALAQLQEAKE